MRIALLLCIVVIVHTSGQSTFTDISGPLTDAKCDVEDVEAANSNQLYSILEEITNTTYFRLLKVNMAASCEFFNKEEPKACDSQPAAPKLPFEKPKPPAACSLDTSGSAPSFLSNTMSDPVDTTISPAEDAVHDKVKSVDDCEDSRFWLDMCRNIGSNDSELINLQLNPERHTGYNGSKVWAAIYKENCLHRTGSEGGLCYEERVLYRLLSAMHTSINTHIALAFYAPSKRLNRTSYEPNAERFLANYGGHPERIKNLHFAFVLLLRAVKKMAPALAHYSFEAAPSESEEYTGLLVDRLLQSSIMRSCSPIFDAFDESMLFGLSSQPEMASPFESQASATSKSAVVASKNNLKRQFKGIFQNVSKVLDCVACQKCKLHGKIALMGVGTALKVLLVPDQLVATSFNREELVALFNTLFKFSTAIKGVDSLFELARTKQQAIANVRDNKVAAKPVEELRHKQELEFNSQNSLQDISAAIEKAVAQGVSAAMSHQQQQQQQAASQPDGTKPATIGVAELDQALGAIAALSKEKAISGVQEDQLVQRALSQDAALLLLAKHFGWSPAKFAHHALQSSVIPASSNAPVDEHKSNSVDAVIIGAGLSGLVAALQLIDNGFNVVLIEKESVVGGNSAWASSGINAVDPALSKAQIVDNAEGDSLEMYVNDMLKGGADPALARVLVENSHSAVEWLQQRADVHLEHLGQLGGHSFARTYRPGDGLTGSKLVFALKKVLGSFDKQRFKLQLSARVSKILKAEDGTVQGVEWSSHKVNEGAVQAQPAKSVIIATGGYASKPDTKKSLLAQHRPDLLNFATTNGRWAVGDGISLASNIGAKLVDMENVQVHPTAFIDPKKPDAETKTLCAEILRGSGAVLVDPRGERFVNELEKRDYVTAHMVDHAKNLSMEQPNFYLVLNGAGAAAAQKHVTMYSGKGLLQQHQSLDALAQTHALPLPTLKNTFAEYDRVAAAGNESVDTFGKKYFHNTPLSSGPFYTGVVTPALHYSMGGLAINEQANVLDKETGMPIGGLYAAGEVVGGIHGTNRLGGNAMTECVVFGIIAARSTINQLSASATPSTYSQNSSMSVADVNPVTSAVKETPASGGLITIEQLKKKNGLNGAPLWAAIHGQVYDLTEFAEEHPAGPEPIFKAAGTDATEMFDEIHSIEMLDDFEPIGKFGPM